MTLGCARAAVQIELQIYFNWEQTFSKHQYLTNQIEWKEKLHDDYTQWSLKAKVSWWPDTGRGKNNVQCQNKLRSESKSYMIATQKILKAQYTYSAHTNWWVKVKVVWWHHTEMNESTMFSAWTNGGVKIQVYSENTSWCVKAHVVQWPIKLKML